ncbi:hypothetical protein NMG60_11004668, partial [Bertholletia excelsa]
MNKLNFVRDGAMKLPPGFRFQPTEEEIVFQYLTRKIFSNPLPASVVPEINLCQYDPWDLPGEEEEDRYFFTKRETKYQNGNRKRTTSSGYWKATGSDKRITSSRRSDLIGMRKTLVFYRGKPPNGSRTDWIMHEYRLVKPVGSASCSYDKHQSSSTQITMVQTGDWVLCHLFLTRRGMEKDGEAVGSDKEEEMKGFHDGVNQRAAAYDFMRRDSNDNIGPTSSSSSSSSSSCGSSIMAE